MMPSPKDQRAQQTGAQARRPDDEQRTIDTWAKWADAGAWHLTVADAERAVKLVERDAGKRG